MTEDLISFELAVLAKEVGFDVPCSKYFKIRGLSEGVLQDFSEREQDFNTFKNLFSRPAQSLLQKWLREEYNIDLEISVHLRGGDRFYRIDIYENAFHLSETEEYPTYEEALEEGLKEALIILN